MARHELVRIDIYIATALYFMDTRTCTPTWITDAWESEYANTDRISRRSIKFPIAPNTRQRRVFERSMLLFAAVSRQVPSQRRRQFPGFRRA